MADREKWKKNFSEWFDEAIWNSEIMDTRYPVKGLYVWLPYGLNLRNRVFSIIRSLLEEAGHREVLFPLLIPEDLFNKEAEHIRGFEDQVYWVTHGGKDRLDIRLALRPTSETSIYPMFSLWVRSHADLPLKVYQVVNIFRYETKMTKPLVRLREVTTFKEAHTVHESMEDAEKQVKEAVSVYRKFFDDLGVPYVITKRPNWDKFAGAVYSIAFDTLAPDGRTLQIGTVHNLGQNFSKVYDIKFEKQDGSHEHAYQTCYGISERAVAAVIMCHGDDIGPCYPPKVAPVQVVVIPVQFSGDDGQTISAAEKVSGSLKNVGLRVILDAGDARPGWKYYHWDRHGVPLRIEIGPEEVATGRVTAVRRDTGEHVPLPLEDLPVKVTSLLEDVEENLKQRAWRFFNERVVELHDVEEAKRIIDARGGIVRIPWCGGESCGVSLGEKTGGTVLGEELENRPNGKMCPVCSKKAEFFALIARTY